MMPDRRGRDPAQGHHCAGGHFLISGDGLENQQTRFVSQRLRNSSNIGAVHNMPNACFCDVSVLPWSLELEQDLSAAIRFQRLLERFLELVERVHMLHCG